MTSSLHNKLSLSEKIRLRLAFSRWEKNPRLFANEIATAHAASELAERHGYLLTVDRRGCLCAQPPAHIKLTGPEIRRLKARIPQMTKEEQTSTNAALSAAEHRGFSLRISEGKLLAIAPKSRIL